MAQGKDYSKRRTLIQKEIRSNYLREKSISFQQDKSQIEEVPENTCSK